MAKVLVAVLSLWAVLVEVEAFSTGRPVTPQLTPVSVLTTVDIDNDGHIDFFVASERGLSWLPNSDGVFADQMRSIPAAGDVIMTNAAPAFINNDNNLDVVWCTAKSTLGWTPGAPFGQWGTPVSLQNTGCVDLAVQDVNHDEHPDIVVGTSSCILVMLNSGNGTFPEQRQYAHNTSVGYLRLLDVNRDGHLDLLITTPIDRSLGWLPGHGDGSFGPVVPLLSFPWDVTDVAVADVLELGYPQVVVGGTGHALVVIEVAANGSVSNTTVSSWHDGSLSDAYSIAVGDCDGDGRLDLVVAWRDMLQYYRNTGGGQFSSPVRLSGRIGYRHVALADTRGLGILDVLSGGEDSPVTLYLNQLTPTHRFDTAQNVLPSDITPWRMLATDLGGNSSDLLVVSSSGLLLLRYLPPPSPTIPRSADVRVVRFNLTPSKLLPLAACQLTDSGLVDVLGEHGRGISWMRHTGRWDGLRPIFEPLELLHPVNKTVSFIACGDLDADGTIDLALSIVNDDASLSAAVLVLLNNGNNTFREVAVHTDPIVSARHIVLSDFNNDGLLDLLVTSAAGTDGCAVGVWYNAGDGVHFSGSVVTEGLQPAISQVGASVDSTALDIDQDGFMDFVSLSPSEEELVITLNDGNGRFNNHSRRSLRIQQPTHITAADFTGNGWLDLCVVGSFGVECLLNDGNFLIPNYLGKQASLVGGWDIVAIDFDQDGQVDLMIADFGIPSLAFHRNLGQVVSVSFDDWLSGASSRPATRAAPVKSLRPLLPVSAAARLPAPDIVHISASRTNYTLTRPWIVAAVPFTSFTVTVFVLPPGGLHLECCIGNEYEQAGRESCVLVPSSSTLRVTGGPLSITGCTSRLPPSLSRAYDFRALRFMGDAVALTYAPLCRSPVRASRTTHGTFCLGQVPLLGNSSTQPGFPTGVVIDVQRPPRTPAVAVTGTPWGAIGLYVSSFAAHAHPKQTVGIVADCDSSTVGCLDARNVHASFHRWVFLRCRSGSTGGSVSLVNGNVSFYDCLFHNNSAPHDSGGALSMNLGFLAIYNCTFTHNHAKQGGAVAVTGDYPNSKILQHVVATDNTADTYGGFLYQGKSATAKLMNAELYRNRAQWGGAIAVADQSVLTLLHVNVANCSGSDGGGAFYVFQSSLLLTKSRSVGCTSGGRGGAGLFLFSSFGTNGVELRNNTARSGGALHCEGIFSGTGQSSLVLLTTNILHNVAEQGGGIFSSECIVSLGHTVVAYNRAARPQPQQPSLFELGDAAGCGGGVAVVTSLAGQTAIPWQSVRIENNTAYNNGGGMWLQMLGRAISLSNSSEVTKNTAVTGGGGGVYTTQSPLGVWVSRVTDNTAAYSPDFGTNARHLTVLRNEVSTTKQHSGVTFVGELVLALQDDSYSTVASDSSSVLTLEPVAPGVILLQQGRSVAHNGIFNLSLTFAVSVTEAEKTYQLSWHLPTTVAVALPPALTVYIGGCSAGFYFDGRSRRCQPCPPGTFASTAGHTECVACPPGTFAANRGSSHCEQCGRPLYAEGNRSTTCSRCSAGTLWVSNRQPCGLCPDGQVASDDVCVCPLLSVREPLANGGFRCVQCSSIPGALCKRNSSGLFAHNVQALPGYWHDANDPLHFIPCPFSASCLPHGCAPHATGPCCMRCADNAYRDIEGVCSVCPAGGVSSLALVVFAMAAVVTVLAGTYMHNVHIEWDHHPMNELRPLPSHDADAAAGADADDEADDYSVGAVVVAKQMRPPKRSNTISVVRRSETYQATALFKIVVGHVQILFLVVAASGSFSSSSSSSSSHSGGFPSALRRFAAYLGVGILRVFHVVPLACASDNPYEVNLTVTLLLPVVLTGLVALAGVLLQYWRRWVLRRPLTWTDVYQRMVKAFCVLIVLVYPLTTAELLETFFHRRCGSHLDTVGLDAELNTSSRSYTAMQVLSVLGLCVYTLGIPLGFVLKLVHHRADLWNPNAPVALKYAFLYQDLKPSHWWFFPVAMLEKVGYAALVVFLNGRSTQQYTAEILLTLFSVVSLAVLQPYTKWFQGLLLSSRLVIFLTLFGAVVLKLQDTPDTADAAALSSSRDRVVDAHTLGALLIVLNLVVLLLPLGFVLSLVRRRMTRPAHSKQTCWRCCDDKRSQVSSATLRERLLT